MITLTTEKNEPLWCKCDDSQQSNIELYTCQKTKI